MGGHENIKKARVTVEELETLGQLLPIISCQAWAEMVTLNCDTYRRTVILNGCLCICVMDSLTTNLK